MTTGEGADQAVLPAPNRTFGAVGATLILLGGVACVLAFTALTWLRSNNIVIFDDLKFRKVHDLLNVLHTRTPKYIDYGVSRPYFSWLAWVLLTAVVVIGLLAVLPTPFAGPLRALGLIVALGSIGLTFWAIDLVSFSGPLARQLGSNNPGYTDYLSHAGPGFWVAAAGFLVMGIGALLGPRPVPQSIPPFQPSPPVQPS
ncbi:MAG TPA: hypothetical protein VKB75_05935 [Jatrophihabitans sp.]|nr:hypothetical protein [Jatrophihabitans sp.]